MLTMKITSELIQEDGDFLISEIKLVFMSDTEIHIQFEAERLTNKDDEVIRMVDNIQYFVDHKSDIEELVLTQCENYYHEEILPKLQEYEDVFSISLDKNPARDHFKEMLKLVRIYIDLSQSENNSLGLSFSCLWDPEHGFGMKINSNGRFLVGGADVAF